MKNDTKNDAVQTENDNVQTEAVDYYEELVDYIAPLLGAGEPQDIFAGVNGQNIRIRRGEPVKIKRKFLEVLKNADAQERAALTAMQKAKENSLKPYAEM